MSATSESDGSGEDDPLVLKKRGGENCPFYRDRESQSELLADMAGDAIREAVQEHGVDPSRVVVETKYWTGRTEPHTSYAEVRVYDRYKRE